MARWTASAKWAAGPALDGQRDMPLGLSLSEGLGGIAALESDFFQLLTAKIEVPRTVGLKLKAAG